eukprot:scaffold4516_cov417-Prasinococcus_capsulatus_cf.AAC.8
MGHVSTLAFSLSITSSTFLRGARTTICRVARQQTGTLNNPPVYLSLLDVSTKRDSSQPAREGRRCQGAELEVVSLCPVEQALHALGAAPHEGCVDELRGGRGRRRRAQRNAAAQPSASQSQRCALRPCRGPARAQSTAASVAERTAALVLTTRRRRRRWRRLLLLHHGHRPQSRARPAVAAPAGALLQQCTGGRGARRLSIEEGRPRKPPRAGAHTPTSCCA